MALRGTRNKKSAAMRGRRVSVAALTAGLAGMLAVDHAAAQQTNDEIIVTATRRETNLQETPVAVSALSAKAVESLAPRDLGDVAALVPNFSASKVTGFNAASFAIRGAAQTDIIVYSEPQVGVTLDDFVVPHVQTQLLDLFDIEAVEVLRGPQGTLFGKNTTAGVVNVRTKKPELGVLGADGRFAGGSFGTINTKLALNIPLGDTLAFRFAGNYEKSEGYYRNGASYGPITGFAPSSVDGRSGQGDGRRLGGTEVVNLRAKLRWQPTDNFDAILQYELVRDDSDSVPAINETPVGDPRFIFNLLGWTQDPGDPLDNAGITDQSAIGVEIGLGRGHTVDVNGYYLNVNWDLGDVRVTSVTGFRGQKSRLASNYAGEVGPISQFDANRADDRETFQQEVRLNWDATEDLSIVAGGFYQSNDTTFCVTQTLGFLDLFGLGTPDLFFNNTPQVLCNAQDASAYALFADATYDLTSRLTIAGGFRYTWEEKDWIGRNQVAFQALGTAPFDPTLTFASVGLLGASDFDRFPNGVLTSSASFEEPSWRGSISYKFTDDVFGYFTASRGFRSGAFNDQSGTTGNALTPLGVAATRPEIALSYEVGLRTDWFGDTFRFNPTFFFVNYKDAQRQIAATLTNSAGVTFQETRFFNAAEVQDYGIELESEWTTPVEGLNLGGNFSWQKGEFKSFEADTDFDGDIDVDFSDRPLTRTPEKTWAVFARYEKPLQGEKMLRMGATVSHEDEQIFNYSDVDPDFDTTLNAKTLVSASIEIAGREDSWFLRIVGRNLTDKRYRVSSQPVANLWTFSQYGEPRFIGAEIGFSLQ